MTDVVVLVVAADDGVKPQTREALRHAQASGCPIVVALTKCDRPGADPPAARAQLAELGLELEENGGTVQVRPSRFYWSKFLYVCGRSMSATGRGVEGGI